MKSLTPKQYAKEVWGGCVTCKTVRNWIKKGRPLKGVDRIEMTPTGHYVLFLSDTPKTRAQTLLEQMKAKAA